MFCILTAELPRLARVSRPTPGHLQVVTSRSDGDPAAGKGRLASLPLVLSKRRQPKLSRVAHRPLACHGYSATYATRIAVVETWEFDVGVSTHDLLKAGVCVDHWTLVQVAAPTHLEAQLIACQMAAAGGWMPTDVITRI